MFWVYVIYILRIIYSCFIICLFVRRECEKRIETRLKKEGGADNWRQILSLSLPRLFSLETQSFVSFLYMFFLWAILFYFIFSHIGDKQFSKIFYEQYVNINEMCHARDEKKNQIRKGCTEKSSWLRDKRSFLGFGPCICLSFIFFVFFRIHFLHHNQK